MTIKKKVYALAGMGASFTALVSICAILALYLIGAKLVQVAEEDIPLTNKVSEITIHQLEQAVLFERSVRYAESMADSAQDKEKYQKTKEHFIKLAKKVDKEILDAEKMTADILAYEKSHGGSKKIVEEFEHVEKILKKIEREHADFDEHVYKVYDLYESGQFKDAKTEVYKVQEEEDQLDHALESLLLELEKFTAEAALEAEHLEQKFLVLIIILSIVSIIIFCLFSNKIVKGIVQPLLATKHYADELSNGNLAVDQPQHDCKDEIADMMASLSVFKQNAIEAEQLKKEQERLREEQKIKEIEAQEAQKEMILELADSFDSQVGGVITSLTTAAVGLQSTAESMKDIADETKTSSQTVAASSEQSNMNVNNVASAIEEMARTSEEIAQRVAEVKLKSNESADDASKANGTVLNLNDLTANIGEIVDAIREIAEQTNVLALNANIEAARAGDAGKGFAVVANEVKKLATETGRKINLIETKISEIQDATGESVSAMQRIIDNISNIDESVISVSSSIEGQGDVSREITRNASEALQGVQSVTEVIHDVQRDAEETETSAVAVLSSAKEVTSLSESLKESVNMFLGQVRSRA